jgi:poly(A) polymerase
MKPSLIIPPQNWMTQNSSIAVMQAIGGDLDPPESLFVGGCVRNAMMGLPVHDIDIATRHEPSVIMDRLEQAGIKHLPTGLKHGTVTAICDGVSFEITTLRRDEQTDGRHATVSYTQSWEEDAHRRDFTMNTLLANTRGEIFDPTGRGVLDIQKKLVVFVGDPEKRIQEDHLRILRFFRFLGLYGTLPADPSALAACRKGASLISALSKERVTQEVFKILSMSTSGSVWMLMKQNGVLVEIIDESFKPEKLNHLCAMQDRHESKDVLTRLMLGVGERVDSLEKCLIFSNAQKNQMGLILKAHAKMHEALSEKILRECVYRFGNAQTLQAYFLLQAQKDQPEQAEYVDILKYWHAPVFPVTGDDLIKQGHHSCPELGRILKSMEEEWIASDFKAI